MCVHAPTLSLSSVFWDVREAIEMVSGWLLASPWLSSSSPSLWSEVTIAVNSLPRLLKTLHLHLLKAELECNGHNDKTAWWLLVYISFKIIKMLFAHRLPLCLVVVALGMWMGSFRAPRRWTVRSWMTSLMCLIQSCLFSILEAYDTTHNWVRQTHIRTVVVSAVHSILLFQTQKDAVHQRQWQSKTVAFLTLVIMNDWLTHNAVYSAQYEVCFSHYSSDPTWVFDPSNPFSWLTHTDSGAMWHANNSAF